MDKFNVWYIVKNHFKTFNKGHCLEQNRDVKFHFPDFIIFFSVPIFMVLCFVLFFKIEFSNEFYGSLLTILSISVPLLLNLLVLMYDMINNIGNKPNLTNTDIKIRICIIRETTDNISFSILISLVTLIIIALQLLMSFGIEYSQFVESIVIFLLSWLILTIAMVLKRTHLLIRSY